VNIFGPSGIGKTIVAQQVSTYTHSLTKSEFDMFVSLTIDISFFLQLAYFTFSRNTFSDGVYYFSMKELVNFNYDLKQYMESLLGLQFG